MKPRHVKIVKQTIPYVIAAIIISIVLAELPFKLPLPPLLAGIIVASVMRIMVYVKGKTGKKYRKNIEHGSARWGTEKDIKPFQDSISDNNIPLTATESITMNSRPTTIKYARNKNILCIGGSGSGKTRFFVKPSLLSCDSKDFPASYVVTDPKGISRLSM